MNKKKCIFLFAVLLYFISSAALGNALPAFHPKGTAICRIPMYNRKTGKKITFCCLFGSKRLYIHTIKEPSYHVYVYNKRIITRI